MQNQYLPSRPQAYVECGYISVSNRTNILHPYLGAIDFHDPSRMHMLGPSCFAMLKVRTPLHLPRVRDHDHSDSSLAELPFNDMCSMTFLNCASHCLCLSVDLSTMLFLTFQAACWVLCILDSRLKLKDQFRSHMRESAAQIDSTPERDS